MFTAKRLLKYIFVVGLALNFLTGCEISQEDQAKIDDAFNPEDLFTSYASAVVVSEGDVITMLPAIIGGYNPDGESLIRTNTPVVGAIKITEINPGTVGDGSDGYVVFSYKFVAI